jgi:hypothetical protein
MHVEQQMRALKLCSATVEHVRVEVTSENFASIPEHVLIQ